MTPGRFSVFRGDMATAFVIGVAGVMLPAGSALTWLGQFLAFWVACRSWQLLAAQAGLFGFGHAVLVGAGAYAAVWSMRALAQAPGWTLAVVPLFAAMAGTVCATLVGLLTSRSRGVAYAMITFGLGELLHLLAQAWPGAFGGEAGIAADRALGQYGLGTAGFAGPQAVHLLVGVWAAVALVWATKIEASTFGAAMRLVRDNPARAEALGLSVTRVRLQAMVLAGAGAGVAGALLALQFEVATAEMLASQRSLGFMMAVLVGGLHARWGAAWGAVVHMAFAAVLGLHVASWQLWYGLVFMFVVLVRPEGLGIRPATSVDAPRRGRS